VQSTIASPLGPRQPRQSPFERVGCKLLWSCADFRLAEHGESNCLATVAMTAAGPERSKVCVLIVAGINEATSGPMLNWCFLGIIFLCQPGVRPGWMDGVSTVHIFPTIFAVRATYDIYANDENMVQLMTKFLQLAKLVEDIARMPAFALHSSIVVVYARCIMHLWCGGQATSS